MRRLLHVFFAFAVLLGAGAEFVESKGRDAEITCPCCQDRACDCGMPQAPRTPRCPSGQNTPVAPPVVRVATPAAAQAEAASRRETHPWQGLAEYALAREPGSAGTPRDLPRPPDRALQRMALLSTFRI